MLNIWSLSALKPILHGAFIEYAESGELKEVEEMLTKHTFPEEVIKQAYAKAQLNGHNEVAEVIALRSNMRTEDMDMSPASDDLDSKDEYVAEITYLRKINAAQATRINQLEKSQNVDTCFVAPQQTFAQCKKR